LFETLIKGIVNDTNKEVGLSTVKGEY